MNDDISNLAKLLYEAYCQDVGGVAFNGDPLPTWEDFVSDGKKVTQVGGWYAAAKAAQLFYSVNED